MQSKERPKNNDIDNSLTLMIPIGDGLFVKCTFCLFNHGSLQEIIKSSLYFASILFGIQ